MEQTKDMQVEESKSLDEVLEALCGTEEPAQGINRISVV